MSKTQEKRERRKTEQLEFCRLKICHHHNLLADDILRSMSLTDSRHYLPFFSNIDGEEQELL